MFVLVSLIWFCFAYLKFDTSKILWYRWVRFGGDTMGKSRRALDLGPIWGCELIYLHWTTLFSKDKESALETFKDPISYDGTPTWSFIQKSSNKILSRILHTTVTCGWCPDTLEISIYHWTFSSMIDADCIRICLGTSFT